MTHPAIELTEGLRIEVHVYIGKAKASGRTYFGTADLPSERVANAVAESIPEMIDIAKAKDAEIQASEQ